MRLPRPTRIRAAWARLPAGARPRVWASAGLVAVLSAVLLFRGLRQGGALGGERSNDFAAYHEAAKGVLAGDLVPSYSAPRPYQYPPTLAVLVAPIGLLPRAAASAVWTVGSLALLLHACFGAREALGPRVSGLDRALGFLLVFRMAESDFALGNANSPVLSLLLLGFAAAGRGRSGLGGSILGLAATLKVTPVLILPWILARRRWRMALGFAAGVLIFGAAVPAVVLGPVPFGRALAAFHGSTLRPLDATGGGYDEEPAGGYIPGQSLRSLLHRLLRESDATAHDRLAVMVNLVRLPKAAVDSIYLAVSAAILGLLILRFRGRGREWTGLEIGAALAAMVLISPMSRKAHFVALFPAAAAGFAVLREAPPRRRWAASLRWWGALALSDLTAPAVLGRALSTRVLAFCPLSFAAGLLIVLAAIEGRREGPPGGLTGKPRAPGKASSELP